MERNLLIKKLLSEGFNVKTLVNLSDKQLNVLSVRILSEQNIKGSVKMKKNTDPRNIKDLTDRGVNVEVVENEEECSECQKSVDKPEEIKKPKNKKFVKESLSPMTTKGEINKLIREKLNEGQNPFEKMTLPEDTDDCVYSDGVSKDQVLAQKIANSNARNKFKGKFPGQEFLKNVETAHRTPNGEYRYVVGLKTRNEAGGETDEPFVKDGETKQTEMKEQHHAPATPRTKPGTVPTIKPGERIKPRTPYQPGPGKNPNPKANIPEWMKFDNIKGKK